MTRITEYPFTSILYSICLSLSAASALAQDSEKSVTDKETNFIRNGSFEEADENEKSLSPWFGSNGSLDSNEVVDGKVSVMVDSRESDLAKSPFQTFNQSVEPKPLLGKRIRFSASVKTANRSEGGKAMLWVRVDRKDKNGNIVPAGFDNMQDRPITSDQWDRYEIVVDVARDATSIITGMIVAGKAQAWMDDVRMEIVESEINASGQTIYDSPKTGTHSDFFQTPVYSNWMWLALFAILLMFLSQTKNSFVQRFAVKFTFVYWFLYIFLSTILQIATAINAGVFWLFGQQEVKVQRLASMLYQGIDNTNRAIANWVANNLLGFEHPPVVPTGSGDTAFDWVRIFTFFLLSLVVAILWSLAWRNDSDTRGLRDMLRTGLRYSLALTLLGYGLHKAGFISTQFHPQGMSQEVMFNQSFGDFSPMGLLWAFMRASTMYTFFAGLLEVIPAVLLVFRRTATFGAIAAVAVMANVFLLNVCYDVPVKQYSFHLMIMGCLVLAPELPRIMNVLFWNRTTEPSTSFHQQIFHSKTGIWIYRIAKTLVVLIIFAIPIGSHVYNEVTYEHKAKEQSDYLLLNRGFRWVAETPYNR